MARLYKGKEDTQVALTKMICRLIQLQSGLSDGELEELFGFGAEKPTGAKNNAKTGKSFKRYLQGKHAMPADKLQAIAKKAMQQPWWKLKINADGLVLREMFGSAELQPVLGDLRSGKRLSETLKEMSTEREKFETAQRQLLNSIENYLSCTSSLKFAVIGRTYENADEDCAAIFQEMHEDGFENTLRSISEQLKSYRAEFYSRIRELLSDS